MRNVIERNKGISWKINSIVCPPQREYVEFHKEEILGGLYIEGFHGGPLEKAKGLMLMR